MPAATRTETGMKKSPKPIHETALALLSRREHATLELTRKLRQKGYGAAETAQTIAELTEKNYLNDTRYAEARARSRAQTSKWGEGRIRQELAQHGVEKTLTQTTLEDLSQSHNWLETAHKLLHRKFPQPLAMPENPDPALGRAEAFQAYQKEKARRVSFLTRRGFSLTQALQALNLPAE